MDARRRLIPGRPGLLAAGFALGGCSLLSGPRPDVPAMPAAAPVVQLAPAPAAVEAPEPVLPPPPSVFVAMAPIPDPPAKDVATGTPERRLSAIGELAIAAANRQALVRSRPAAFAGGVQVFAYAPGRIYEVWTAPLRVTTLSLPPGETLNAMAAGDTVRWQIGETRSGEGAALRVHVMIKPIERGLVTNLVLATTRRLYFVRLRSGSAESFNAAVAWDLPAAAPAPPPREADPTPALAAAPRPQLARLDAGYDIRPKGRRPAWTPTAVLTDGRRTYLVFPPQISAGEAPALFARGADGETQLLNYRQQGGLWIVDRVLARAELRLGRRHPQVVRIERTGGGS
jgi:type IV secretion system protein VirB9